MHINEDYLLEVLIDNGVLDAESKEAVINIGIEHNMSIAQATEAAGIMSASDVIMLIAAEYDLETINLSQYKIPAEVIKLVPKEQAQRYNIMPVSAEGDKLVIAMANPADIQIFDALSQLLSMDVQGVITDISDIQAAFNHYYTENLERFIQNEEEQEDEESFSEFAAFNREGDSIEIDDAPVIKLVSLIIVKAYQSNASDIHLEPLEEELRLRYRIDGMMMVIDSPPKYLQNNILSRIKIMASIDITQKRLPQDGRISINIKNKPIDLRVSTIPTSYGESVVMRILDKTNVKLGIPELGMFPDDHKLIERIITYPDGIFLVTGPTGSGKTTSLYAFLNTLNLPDRKIITAEDPIEYDLPGINQCQINTTIGMTFSKILRSMLRQAPNIIMVGEIRDLETASIAIQASLTGHMVFSTLHTNDAPSAVARLLDIGVQPFLIASALRAIMAQRLVRRVCQSCRENYTPTDEELEFMEMASTNKNACVLVVDDDRTTQKMVRKILERNDYIVQVASNGKEALAVLENDIDHAIDIVISDLYMPEMGGLELTKIVNVDYPRMPVVIMSGAEQEDLDKIAGLNIKGCLLKPVNSLHLLNTLQKIYANVLKRRLESTVHDNDIIQWSHGKGCKHCRNGYSGRLGIYEIFSVNEEIQELIFKGASTSALRNRAVDMGMNSLRKDGIRKAMAGLTTIDEVARITVANEAEKFV